MLLDRDTLKSVIREEISRRAHQYNDAIEEETGEETGVQPAEDSPQTGDFEAKGQQAALVNKLMDRISKNQLISGFIGELTDDGTQFGSDKALVALAAFSSMLLGGGDIKDVYQKVSRFQKMQKKVSE